MSTQGSGRIDQSVPSTFINESRFKQLFSDHLLHEETRDFIKKVVLETMGHEDGVAKIKRYAKEAVKEYSEEHNKERKNFWTPNAISILGLLIAIGAALIAYYHK